MQLNSTQNKKLTINEIKLTQPPPSNTSQGQKQNHGTEGAILAFAAHFMSFSH